MAKFDHGGGCPCGLFAVCEPGCMVGMVGSEDVSRSGNNCATETISHANTPARKWEFEICQDCSQSEFCEKRGACYYISPTDENSTKYRSKDANGNLSCGQCFNVDVCSSNNICAHHNVPFLANPPSPKDTDDTAPLPPNTQPPPEPSGTPSPEMHDHHATVAGSILREAATIVDGDRNATHGDKERSFVAIAALWTTYLAYRKNPHGPMRPHDPAQMMVLMKMMRAEWGTPIRDQYVDQCGYSAIAGELTNKS